MLRHLLNSESVHRFRTLVLIFERRGISSTALLKVAKNEDAVEKRSPSIPQKKDAVFIADPEVADILAKHLAPDVAEDR